LFGGRNVDVKDEEEFVLDDLGDEWAHDGKVLAEEFDATNFFVAVFALEVFRK
jgi:hypothetical protein